MTQNSLSDLTTWNTKSCDSSLLIKFVQVKLTFTVHHVAEGQIPFLHLVRCRYPETDFDEKGYLFIYLARSYKYTCIQADLV